MSIDLVFFAVGAVVGALAVAIDVFGRYWLRNRLSPEMLPNFETAVRYQFYHAAALFATALAAGGRFGGRLPAVTGILFIAGLIVFSGTLYIMALTGKRAPGAITPIGALMLIAAWVCLGFLVAPMFRPV